MALWEAGKAPRAVGSLQGLTLRGTPGQGWGEDSVTPGSNVSKEPSLSFCFHCHSLYSIPSIHGPQVLVLFLWGGWGEGFEEGPVARLMCAALGLTAVSQAGCPLKWKGSFSWTPPGQHSSNPENGRWNGCVCNIVTQSRGLGREQAWIPLNPI